MTKQRSTLWLFLFGFCALMIFTGCAEDEPHNNEYPDYEYDFNYNDYLAEWDDQPKNKYYYPRPDSFDGFKDEAQKASLKCKDDNKCPENVGHLMIKESAMTTPFFKVGQCTGFLIAEDIVATNSHCIPKFLHPNTTPNTSCQDNVFYRYLDKNGEVQIRSCKEILAASQLEFVGLDKDYAFLRIEPTDVNPIPISKARTNNGETITLARFTPYGESRPGGKIEISQCQVVRESFLNLEWISSYLSSDVWLDTSVAIGPQCQATLGNSGAPILNAAGEVVGIVQSFMPDKAEFDSHIVANYSPMSVKLPKTFPHHFLFTQMACVPDPLTKSINPNCKAAQTEEKLIPRYCEPGSLDSMDLSTDKLIHLTEEWADHLPQIFLYRLIRLDPMGTTWFALPRCVLQEQRNRVRANTETITYEGNLVHDVTFEFSENYTLNKKLSIGAPTTYPVKVDLEKRTAKQWETYITIDDPQNVVKFRMPNQLEVGTKKLQKIELTNCSEEEIAKGSTTFGFSNNRIIPIEDIIENRARQCAQSQ